jgi:Uma2 family endonuclease
MSGEMQYLISLTAAAAAIFILVDGSRRGWRPYIALPVALIAVAPFLFLNPIAAIVLSFFHLLPIYGAFRPLREGETRSGGRLGQAFKNLALSSLFLTVFNVGMLLYIKDRYAEISPERAGLINPELLFYSVILHLGGTVTFSAGWLYNRGLANKPFPSLPAPTKSHIQRESFGSHEIQETAGAAQTSGRHPHGADGQGAVVLHLTPGLKMSDDQFFELCRVNRDLRIEQNVEGDLLLMPPTGGRTGRRNSLLLTAFVNWEEKDGTGVVFDSSTGFILPNGAKRSPDVSWVRKSRLAGLTDEEKEKFLPLCPDAVVELRSASDSIDSLREKMREYANNGAELGLLFDPQERRVYLYRGTEESVLDDPEVLTAEPTLAGFVLNPRRIWKVDF